MASRERLGHLKFMQRAKLREQEKAKQQETQNNSDQWISDRKPSASSCVVIVEGDPKPSSTSGRMSFRSFNPPFEEPVMYAELEVRFGFSKRMQEERQDWSD